jgi:protein involved in polysaccharide export with SLBB domain
MIGIAQWLPFLLSNQTAPLLPTIQAYDVLVLHCQESPELDGSYRVRRSGAITLPRLGSFAVITLSVNDVERLISKRILSQLGIQSEISLTLTADKSTSITIEGAVKKTYQLKLNQGWKLSEYLANTIALEGAAINKSTFSDINGIRLSPNQIARPGDRISIPLAAFGDQVLVTGGVARPSSPPWTEGLTLGKAIQNAGGITVRGDATKIVIIRDQLSLGPFDLVKDSSVKLLSGDVVRVPVKEDIVYVSVIGFVGKPGLIDWVPGLTIKQALLLAGGVRTVSAVIIKRTVIKSTVKPLIIKWLDLKSGATPDVKIEPGEMIEVTIK